MAIWDGIESVVANQKLPYLTAGSYVVSLVDMVEGVGGLSKEPFFKATYKVVEATGVGATPVGTTSCIVFKRDKYNYFLKDIKNLCAAVLGLPTQEVTAELIQALVDTDEGRGTLFQVDVTEEQKKNGLGSFTKHRFFSAPSKTEAPF